MSELMQAALWYAEMGVNVIPAKPNGKNPFFTDWPNKATTNKYQIIEWWEKNPNYNVAIVTGRKNHLLVVDLDLDKEKGKYGYEFLKDWERENGSFPEDTWMVKTAHGGYHLYFWNDQPQGSPKGLFFPGSGIDVRADNACAVAPPSVIEGSLCYEWEQGPDEFDLQPMNDAVWQFIKEGEAEKEKGEQGEKADRKHRRFKLPDEIPEGTRTDTLVRYIGSLRAKGEDESAIRAKVEAANGERCKPPLTDQELAREVFPALKRDWGPTRAKTAPDIKLVDKLIELDAANSFSWSDKGLGEMFMAVFGDVLGFNPEKKTYMFFNGTKWKVDSAELIAKQHAKRLADALQTYAASYTNLDDERKTAFMRHAMKLMSYRTRMVMIQDAMDLHIIENETLDADDYLLNCLNCTLDLSGPEPIRKEHDANDLISKVCGAKYDPTATCPKWEETLKEIMQGDDKKIEYLQKIFGLSLTGCTREEECYFLFGSTSRNGKSTVAETIMDILGDYAIKIAPETLAAKSKDSRKASPDLAKLKGARMVLASEPPKRMIFDAALLKTLTGRDRVSARLLYENDISFLPIFKLFLNTNYLPMIMDETVFRSDRIRVINFGRHFKPEEQDKHLREKILQKERAGILNWMLEGWRKYQEDDRHNRFEPPDAVRKATEKYARDSDKIGVFFEDCLVEFEGNNIAAKDVYEKYQEWCSDTGQKAEGRKNFYSELRGRGKLADSGTVGRVTVRNVVPGYTFADNFEVPFKE